MANHKSKQTAIEDLQDVEWMGREIRVHKAAQKMVLLKKQKLLQEIKTIDIN